jgi:hypothetical protein
MGIILKLTLRKMVWDVGWIHMDEVWYKGGKFL